MTNKNKVEVIPAAQTRDLRHRILRPHQKFEQCTYPGDDDSTSFHLAVFSGAQVVCVGSFYREPSPLFKETNQYRLRGMATEEKFRRHGAGAQLLSRANEMLRKRECPLLWCYARQVAFPFYEKMGMAYVGDLFEIAGIGPHKVMYRKF